MNILVCISNVPDTTSKIEFTSDSTAFNTEGVQFIINPYDEFGLTKAIKLREVHGGKVTVIHLGVASSEPTLRKALAIGADQAIRIDSEPKDSFSVAQELAKVIAEQDFDLIITGRESIDYNNGAVPGMLAAILDLHFVNACTGFELSNDIANMEREIENLILNTTFALEYHVREDSYFLSSSNPQDFILDMPELYLTYRSGSYEFRIGNRYILGEV